MAIGARSVHEPPGRGSGIRVQQWARRLETQEDRRAAPSVGHDEMALGEVRRIKDEFGAELKVVQDQHFERGKEVMTRENGRRAVLASTPDPVKGQSDMSERL